MQTKLHQWAKADPGRRFDDLANLVYDPAFLVVAWARVRGNKGARTAGVDRVAPRSIVFGVAGLLGGLRDDLKAGRFVPQRVREKTIPKTLGKVRRLGIPTTADRVVQASLKLVLEPIFEADFKPCSYGFRPKRRAQDAIAEIHYLGSPPRNYEWVFEADIKACFDEIDHTAFLDRVRDRIGDKRVLGLVKAFLKAGIITEDGVERDTTTGTPQGNGHLPPGAVRGRLRRLGGRYPSARRGAARRSGSGSSPDGPAPVGGEDNDRPHRRRVRLLGLPHPAATPARIGQAVRVHLAVKEGTRLHQGQGASDHPRRHQPTARSRAPPTEPGAV